MLEQVSSITEIFTDQTHSARKIYEGVDLDRSDVCFVENAISIDILHVHIFQFFIKNFS